MSEMNTTIFTYHLAKTSFFSAIKAILFPPNAQNTKGLIHAECMITMTLGASIFSPSRILVRQVAMFAQWENEIALDNFLKSTSFGKMLSKAWYTRLTFLRQWGRISGFEIPNETIELEPFNTPVVAVTIARMQLFQVPRFISWGLPVEKLVRDHPETTLSLASIRLPQTVSTFSIWNSQKAMTDMVHGHSSEQLPKRHANAMQERERKDFHYEFTTLRFKPIAEFGEWNGQTNYISNLVNKH